MTLFSLGRGQEALDILQRALAGGGDAARLKSLIAEVERGP